MNDQDFFRDSINLIERASTISDAQIIVEGIMSLLEKHPHDDVDQKYAGPDQAGPDSKLSGQVAKIITQLGGEVDEVGQYLLAATGRKSLDDITPDDLKQFIKSAYGPASQAAKQASSQLSPDQIKQGLSWGRGMPDTVAGIAPKGKRGARLPGGGRTDIDVDVSGADVTAGISAFDKVAKLFPKAKDMFDRGEYQGALKRVFDRMGVNPTTPSPRQGTPRRGSERFNGDYKPDSNLKPRPEVRIGGRTTPEQRPGDHLRSRYAPVTKKDLEVIGKRGGVTYYGDGTFDDSERQRKDNEFMDRLQDKNAQYNAYSRFKQGVNNPGDDELLDARRARLKALRGIAPVPPPPSRFR